MPLQASDEAKMPAPIKTYLDEVATSEDLPDLAIWACARRYEEAGPVLRSLLGRAAAGDELSDDDATLLFRGLHISAACRDREVCQPLLRLLRRHIDDLAWLLGDGLTASMERIVASVFDDDVEALFAAIEDRTRDEYARSAPFSAATLLTFDGRIKRERMEQFLQHFYQQRLADEGNFLWFDWAEAIALLGLTSLAPLAEKALSEGLVSDDFMGLKEFREDLAKALSAPSSRERFEEHYLGYMEDAVDELEWTRKRIWQEDETEDNDEDDIPWKPSEESSQPFHNPLRHVGRNDPCPCGSGKKAKRCCLASG